MYSCTFYMCTHPKARFGISVFNHPPCFEVRQYGVLHQAAFHGDIEARDLTKPSTSQTSQAQGASTAAGRLQGQCEAPDQGGAVDSVWERDRTGSKGIMTQTMMIYPHMPHSCARSHDGLFWCRLFFIVSKV